MLTLAMLLAASQITDQSESQWREFVRTSIEQPPARTGRMKQLERAVRALPSRTELAKPAQAIEPLGL
jgi:hypothetical protein